MKNYQSIQQAKQNVFVTFSGKPMSDPIILFIFPFFPPLLYLSLLENSN